MAIRQGEKRHPNWNRESKTFGRCNDIICIKTLKTKSGISDESRMNGYSAVKKKHTQGNPSIRNNVDWNLRALC